MNKFMYAIIFVIAFLVVYLIYIKTKIPNYFTIQDINSRGIPVPKEYEKNAADLVHELNKIQFYLYKENPSYKMTLLSTYRTPERNTAVGGARSSKHMTAEAADFTVQNLDAAHQQSFIKHLIETKRIQEGGIGQMATATHYNINDTFRTWKYINGQGAGTYSAPLDTIQDFYK